MNFNSFPIASAVFMIPSDHYCFNPRVLHTSTALIAAGRGGSIIPAKPTKIKSFSILSSFFHNQNQPEFLYRLNQELSMPLQPSDHYFLIFFLLIPG